MNSRGSTAPSRPPTVEGVDAASRKALLAQEAALQAALDALQPAVVLDAVKPTPAAEAITLDDVRLSPLERLKLTRELATIRAALANNPTTLERLKLAGRLAAVRKALGATTPAPSAEPAPPAANDEAAAESIVAGRTTRESTSRFYDYDPNRKPAQRRAENAAAMELLRAIDAGELKPGALTDEQRSVLAKFSGLGGNLTGADGKKGSAYEYFTPKPIAEGMWSLLAELGFKGGRVLDPSAGVGIFGGTAPVNAAVDAIELNETSGRVNQLVNDGPGYKTVIAPFEQVAAATPDEQYDAIITNVPFGDVKDRGGNQFKDTRYRDEPIQNYFILRSLEKLRPGGLAAFIAPPRCVSGKGGKEQDLRERTSYVAEFVGAYRLPNSVFGTAAADTITDVIVFRKFRREVLDKIAELREQNPAALTAARVVWPEFIEGDYFRGEGRRFVLGEFVAKDPNKVRDVDRVINSGSMTDIARLLRKFPDSRIDWKALDAAETTPIVYREGDTIAHAGQTLQMQGGQWVVIKPAGSEEAAAEMADLLAKLSTPLGAVNAGIGYGAAARFQAAMQEAARALEVPDWARGLLAQLAKIDAGGAREAAWGAATVGLAVDQAFQERQAEVVGFNYLEGYPILSEAMKRVHADAKRPPAVLPTSVKTAMKKVVVHYVKGEGYSGVWRGDVAAARDDRDELAKFEAERYIAGGGQFVPIDKAREVYGEDFDPLKSDEWCLSADGQSVARADDYYVGNYADFLARMRANIEAAADDDIRAKLLRQKAMAEQRLLRVDVSRMQFNLFSPFLSLEEKAEFLRRFVDPRFAAGFDEDGRAAIVFNMIGGPKNVRDKLLKRFALYMNGTRLTLGGADVGDERAALDALRNIAATAEAQLNTWVKGNPIIMGRLHDLANEPQRLYFRQVEDDSPLSVPGLHPNWKTHGYQAAYVRKTGREFGGINGDHVGLGKTSEGLIAAQHALTIGVNKRTAFVVPNSVLSNWRKEAIIPKGQPGDADYKPSVYANGDDCLFVGLRAKKGGGFKADPNAYDADLNRILEGRHRKVFMTYEAFNRLRLKQSTVEAYDTYLASVDEAYAMSEANKANEKTKSLRAQLIEELTSSAGKSMAAPFFEDLGLDSLVFDEAHMLKNSRATVEFKGGKFLSLARPSGRGMDAQAKAWYVRKDRPRRDGVILLTATPITNSPLEIYSMLSLAVGDAKVSDMMLGAKGSDPFMALMCQLENRNEETLDGLIKPYDVFVGLNNVDVLRNAIAATCTIRSAAQVGQQIVMPDEEEKAVSVALPADVVARLQEYKDAFRFAIDTLYEKPDPGGSPEAFERVAERFGEPMELIGHPFNLINKMSMLIADPELDDRATFWSFSPAQAAAVDEVVAKWNAKPPREDRPRKGPHTSDAAIVSTKKKKDGEDVVELLVIEVRAKVDGTRVILDSTDAETIMAFEAAAEKAGIDFDASVPPKLAALIENFQYEETHPRGRTQGGSTVRVRQLIFCDMLALLPKIKRLLSKRCGVAPSAIAIITGKVNGKPEEIIEVQDSFNAEGDDNRYRVIIANEKAEVGINLQKGTQAIHHLTLGWTPDSLTQRNGRGVRQGNETKSVRVYQYHADGTFDSYKRMLVGNKATWIDAVLDPNGGDTVAVSGGLTNEQMTAMIESVGDADAMAASAARAATAEKLARETSTRGKQAIHLGTIRAQQDFLKKYDDAKAWAADKIAAYVAVKMQIGVLEERVSDPKATAAAVLRNQNLLAEAQARANGMKELIEESVTILGGGDYRTAPQPMSLDEFVRRMRGIGASFSGDLGKMTAENRARTIVHKAQRGYEFTVRDDGAIGNEWQSEVDMANSLIEASRQDFARLGQQPGGHSAAVLARIDAGEAQVIDGKVITVGTFAEYGEFLGVVRQDGGALRISYINHPRGEKNVALVDHLRKAQFTLPGAPGYDALITRAAAIEDEIGASGQLDADKLETLASAVVPQVAQRRTKPLLVRYYARNYELPSPHFPRVSGIEPTDTSARVAAMVAAEQAKVITLSEVGGEVYFSCESTLDVKEFSPYLVEAPWGAALDFARSRKVKITQADFEAFRSGWGDYSATTLKSLRAAKPADFKAAIAGATTEAELAEKARAWLRDEAFPDYEIEQDADWRDGDLLGLLATVGYGAGQAFREAQRAIERAAAGEQPQPEVPAAAAGLDGDERDTVGVKGDTMRWKAQIKEMGQRFGGGARWDGNGVLWNLSRRAARELFRAFPAAAQGLHIVPATSKLTYR